MCGFVGWACSAAGDNVTLVGHEEKSEVLGRMMDRIIHRGPDMAGEFVDDDVCLGFRRLSIIDLSDAGCQPMSNSLEDSSLVIVFNGEIYNFADIKKDLMALGHKFANDTDTEVLIHGYEQWGKGILDRVRGMFSFVIYDKNAKTLFGARDFFGIKPFYYTRLDDGTLLFGSEIKSFLEHPRFKKEVNENALLPYLTFQYSAQDETFFKNVYKLPPAHSFSYRVDSGELSIERFWDAKFSERRVPFSECAKHLDEVINESVEAHRIADVKVGTFLSGGIDSSYITASMMPDKTFSVGFSDSGFDETIYAKELSEILGIGNFREMCSPDACFEIFPTIQYHMDEPQSNPSSVPLYFLAQLASKQVTVVLSGEGGDEIFAGYHWYNDSARMRKLKKLPAPIRQCMAKVAAALPNFRGQSSIIKSSGRPEDFFIGHAYVFPENEAVDIVKPAFKNAPTPKDITRKIYDRVPELGDLEKRQYLDLNLWQPGDILLKADKMSMAHSLELRVPFLDKVVMETAQTLPADYKINEKNTKYILRVAANRTIPDDWANRTKLGFPVPIRHWLREQKYADIVRSYFDSDFAKEFFETEKLIMLLDEHFAGRKDNGRKIWTAWTFLVWYKRFFIDEQCHFTDSTMSCTL